MRYRLLLSIVCCLALLASSLAPASAQDVEGLDGVRAAYRDLLDLFYRPVAPAGLLQAGWTTLRAAAPRRGAAAPGPLPDLPDDPDAAFQTFAGAYTNYVASLPPSFTPTMAAAAIESGMADSVHEQHTHYLPPSIMQRFLSTVGGGDESIGLGVQLSGNTPGLITEVAPGGPADAAGLQPGDLVVAVDGHDISSADTPTLASTLVGPQGSTVKVSIDRGDGEQQTFVIARGPYYFPPLNSNVLPGGVGYVRLTDFVISGTTLPNGTEVLADLDRRLDDLDGQGAQSLILDLRNNGGGSVQTADEILGRFLPEWVRTVREYDARGHQTFEIASGRLHARQLPMAVLINGGSASASEMTAAALRDAHRAILVGQKTAGALASSELLPLPGGGGIQIAVAAANAPGSTTELDGIGVSPDVVAPESRTVADYRTGHDPLLDAAVAALSRAPAPPPAWPAVPALGPLDLDRLVGGALPGSDELPTNDRLTVTTRWQRLDYLHPNELIDQNGGSPDPVALMQASRARGYQGTAMASYGAQPGDLPTVSVDVDLYATTDGAHKAISTNDIPDLQQPMDPPVVAGEETTAYRGAWLATGSALVVWRRGRAVFTVTYSDVPGFDRPDTLVAIVQLVDARAAQLTIPH